MTFPQQMVNDRRAPATGIPDTFDMREQLTPRRLTLAMWDQAFALRHGPGGSGQRGRGERSRVKVMGACLPSCVR